MQVGGNPGEQENSLIRFHVMSSLIQSDYVCAFRRAESVVRRKKRLAFAALIGLITAMAIVVRLRHINHPMRYDESYNYLNFVVRGPAYIATHYLPNNHVLHTLGVWFSMKVVGNAPAALRIPAFLAGVLIVPATALLAWRVSRRVPVVIFAALAVCGSSALVEYSTSARGYSLLTLCTVVAVALFHWACDRPGQWRRWVAWGVVGAAGFYTVPIMILPLAGMVVFGAMAMVGASKMSERGFLIRGVVLGCVVFVVAGLFAYAPVMVTGGMSPVRESGDMAFRILGEQITSRFGMLSTMSAMWTRHASALLVAPAVMGIAVSALFAIRNKDRSRLLLLFPILIPILLAMLVHAPMPARTWLFALPFAWILAAQGLDDLGRIGNSDFIRRALGPIACTLTGIALFSTLIATANARSLCSEPGGLVLVERGLKECAAFGEERCAFLAPYSPATAYYKSVLGVTPVSDPASPLAERVYIATSAAKRLEDVWNPMDAGFGFFGRPVPIWECPEGGLYVADRVDRNVLR